MWRGSVARPSLLTPRVVAPPPGGLVTMSRSLHSKGHMDITVTVTGKANFSLLASFLKSQCSAVIEVSVKISAVVKCSVTFTVLQTLSIGLVVSCILDFHSAWLLSQAE